MCGERTKKEKKNQLTFAKRFLCVVRQAAVSAAPGQHCGQWTVSIFHGSFKSFVCVCLIALLPQARQRQ